MLLPSPEPKDFVYSPAVAMSRQFYAQQLPVRNMITL